MSFTQSFKPIELFLCDYAANNKEQTEEEACHRNATVQC